MDTTKTMRHPPGRNHVKEFGATHQCDIEGRAARDACASTRVPAGPETVAHERIALRAYELFLARGGGEGRDLEDWLGAEAELCAKTGG